MWVPAFPETAPAGGKAAAAAAAAAAAEGSRLRSCALAAAGRLGSAWLGGMEAVPREEKPNPLRDANLCSRLFFW